MIRGNAMTCYEARLKDGTVKFLSAYSAEQAAGLLLYQLPAASIVSLKAVSDGFDAPQQ
jgi:hypothetical protein